MLHNDHARIGWNASAFHACIELHFLMIGQMLQRELSMA